MVPSPAAGVRGGGDLPLAKPSGNSNPLLVSKMHTPQEHTYLFDLAVGHHEIGQLHDLELVQLDHLSVVERLELLESSVAGSDRSY